MKPLSAAHAALVKRLDGDQERVAAWGMEDGHLVVQAGAGAGKTTTVTALVANLVAGGLPPHLGGNDIVVTTYSNRAGKEITARLDAVIPFNVTARPTVGTFHALALRALRQRPAGGALAPAAWADSRNVDADGRRRTVPASWAIWRAIAGSNDTIPGLTRKGLDQPPQWRDEATRAVARLRAHGLATAAEAEDDEARVKEILGGVVDTDTVLAGWRLYEQSKAALGAWDFDDVLFAWRDRLRVDRSGAAVVIVDEAQDQNITMLQIACALAGLDFDKLIAGSADPHKTGSRLILVGQSAQTIHRWNGAFPRFFVEAPTILKAQVLTLGWNYRSGSAIVDAGNRVLQGVPALKDPLVAQSGRPDLTSIIRTLGVDHADDVVAAQAVGAEIVDAIAAGVTPGEIAVLARTNAVLGTYNAVFKALDIPCVLVGGRSIFAEREAHDFLAYCVLSQHDDHAALERIVNVPRRYLGKAFVGELRQHRKPNVIFTLQSMMGKLKPAMVRGASSLLRDLTKLRGLPWEAVPDAVRELLRGDPDLKDGGEDDPAEDRPAIYDAMCGIAKRFSDPESLVKFADHCAQTQTQDAREGRPGGDKVVLTSVHRAKGLEFDRVYLESSEGHLPFWRAIPQGDKSKVWDGDDLLDEVRIWYVGVTRARKDLVFVASRQPRGRLTGTGGPSRFLTKFHSELL